MQVAWVRFAITFLVSHLQLLRQVVRHHIAQHSSLLDPWPRKSDHLGSILTVRDFMDDMGMIERFDVGLEMSGAAPAMRQMITHVICERSSWGVLSLGG